MSADPRRCPDCGATAPRQASRFCEYCGTELPKPATPKPAATSPFGDVDARFLALEGSADYAARLAHSPVVPNPVGAASLAGSTAIIAIISVFGVGIALVTGLAFPPMAAIPLVIVGLAVFFICSQWVHAARFERSPIASMPALIVANRTKVSGGGGQAAARTQYFATVQTPDGQRLELEALDGVVGTLAAGDIGIAYTKAGFLVLFDRADG